MFKKKGEGPVPKYLLFAYNVSLIQPKFLGIILFYKRQKII